MQRAFFIVVLLAARALAACECGYTITTNSSTSGQALFTDTLQTDFTTTEDVTWDSQSGPDWVAQSYNVTPAAARGPYGKAAEVQNVIWNPLSVGSTGGQGVNGGDPGLQLWVRSQLVDNDGAQLVPMSEVVSSREDILYGSFRVGMKTTGVNGTCAGFFYYHNNSEEIDVEMLSRETQAAPYHLNFVNQSPQSVAQGYNAANTSGFGIYGLSFNPSTVYAEYRFDWLPGRIDFYVNNVSAWSMTENVPADAGAIHLIHWSNGSPGWTAGPPTQDAVLTVSYVNAYFNSSANSTDTSPSCSAGSTCPIPDNSGTTSQPDVVDSVPTVTAVTSVTTATSTSTPAPTQKGGVSGLSSDFQAPIWCVVAIIGLVSFWRL